MSCIATVKENIIFHLELTSKNWKKPDQTDKKFMYGRHIDGSLKSVVPNHLGVMSRCHALFTFLVLCDIKTVINIPICQLFWSHLDLLQAPVPGCILVVENLCSIWSRTSLRLRSLMKRLKMSDEASDVSFEHFILQKFAANFCKFLVFLGFLQQQHWKWLFRPAFGVCSTQTLVEIYNRCSIIYPCKQTIFNA